jgi:hypothetical protein
MNDSKVPIPPGSTFTAIITGTADAEYFSRDHLGPMHVQDVRLADGTLLSVPARRGAVMVPGDILPVVQEALKTAIRFWEPAEEIADCATCGPGDALGTMCSAHAADRVQADRYRHVLKALPGGASC